MVALAYYLGIAVIIATLYGAIRWRGILSYEGIGFFCSAGMVAADALGIATALMLGTDAHELDREIADRLFPGIVFELGMLALVGGLALVNPRPRPVSASIDLPGSRATIAVAALAMLMVGLAFKLIAMISFGVSNISGYMSDLGGYTIGQRGLGGFLDFGLPLAIVGIALLAATARNVVFAGGAFVVAASISFLLSYSRAEFFGTFFVFLIVLSILRPDMVALAKRRVVLTAACGALILTGIIFNSGIKSAMRIGRDVGSYSLAELGEFGVHRWVDRFSEQGLYDGYCNLVNRLSDNPQRLWRGDVGIYAVTSAVPYFLYPSKPVHPFRDTGDLVYDHMNSSVEDVCAMTLVGSAYADWGMVTGVGYLFLYGIVTGVLRIVLLRGGVFYKLLYINLIIIEGSTNFIHAGILAFVPSLALNSVVILIVYVTCRLSGSGLARLGPPIEPPGEQTKQTMRARCRAREHVRIRPRFPLWKS